MKPGRELDALIAEHVMGYSNIYIERATLQFPGRILRVTYGQGYEVPAYSTDIAAAWEVCEKFGAYQAETHHENNDHIWGFLGPQKHEHLANWCYARESTAPHAICLAALKAVGYKE